MKWQSHLWQQIVSDLQSESDEQVFTTSHRAYLQQNYFAKLDDLTETEKPNCQNAFSFLGFRPSRHYS